MDIVFATGNKHKLQEVNELIGHKFNIISLSDLNFHEDIPEPYETLEENALEKARVIHQKFGKNCFSEDTGLEVAALNGAPGVYSARYAGSQKSASDNIQLLLKNLAGEANRTAQFRTVAALIIDDKEYLFEGIVKGIITKELSGEGGFGYDPVFQPEGYTYSFAEMDGKEKNSISHRGRAIKKLVAFLDNYQTA